MKTLILALVFIALSVAMVSLLEQGNGYVLFGYGEWTVEGSLAFFILLDLLLFILLYLAIRTLARIWSMPERLQAWKKGRQKQRARNSLANGLMDLAAGKWKSAEQKLLKHVESSDKPLLNYLGAAQTAQQRGDLGKRDSYLQLAHESMPSADLAVTLTQAELQLSNDQMEQALATLMHLRKIAPRHSHVLKLLKELYLKLEDWPQLQQLLPELKKRDVISQDELEELELKSYVELLNKAAAEQDNENLDVIWRKAPKRLRSNSEIVPVYVQHTLASGSADDAERLLRDAISSNWDEQLVDLYGLVDSKEPARQLNQAESWLEQYPTSPVLLLALAHICLRSKLWGKARNYLEASIGAGPTAEAHQELGMLLEQMGEKDLALENFRAGLELVSNGPASRGWVYDGRKAKDDAGLESISSDIRQPMDAPLPVAGESS